VTVTLRPTVLANETVRVEVDAEGSIFVPAAGDVALEKDTSEARTIMNALSGRTIVIGGLTWKVSASSNAGVPWLRRFPLLNLALAARESEQTRPDVVVYIMPYLGQPGMNTPLLRPASFGVQGDGCLFTIAERPRRREYAD
jgi:type II secretory pathway component GspD/PulD (secretin)